MPTTGDTAVIDSGDNVTVNANQSAPNVTLAGGTITFSGGPTLDVGGTLTVNSGTMTGNGTLNINGALSKTTASQWTIQNAADVLLNASASVSGGNICLIDGTGTGAAGDPSFTIANNSTLTLASGIDANSFNCSSGLDGPAVFVAAGSHLAKSATGTVTISTPTQVAGTIEIGAGQTLNFNGEYRLVAGGTTTVAASETLGGSGPKNITGGTLTATGTVSGPVTVSGTGVLRGTGQVSGDVTNTSGTVRPGTSPGTLAITGSFTQGASGTLEIDVNGTSAGSGFDVLSVGAAATLAGTLAIVRDSSFDPQNSDTFQFLTSASRTGSFGTLTGAALSNGRSFGADYPGSPSFGARLVVLLGEPPGNTTPPQISGSALVGEELTCLPGTWTNSPTFSYEWLRDGQPIAGATSDTYTLLAADATHEISCRVTASNSGGDTEATSATVTVPAVPPANTQAPSVSGNPAVGQTLTCNTGTWTGAPTPALAVQWLRDGQPIPGATQPSYTVTEADAGHELACQVTATNPAGSSSTTSAGVSVPTVPASTPDVTKIPKVPDFVTAVFVPPTLYLRLKCPARFKPGCIGSAAAVTSKDHCKQESGHPRCTHGVPMSTVGSAAQKAGSWKVVPLKVKPSYVSKVQAMGAHPDKRLLVVRQVIHAKRFRHGRRETVFHVYRVQTSTAF